MAASAELNPLQVATQGMVDSHGRRRLLRQETAARKYTKQDSFTCKSRHARCDEKKPVCTNCERLKLQCRASEFITTSAWCAVVESSPPQRERESVSFNNSDGRVGPTAGTSPTSTWDIFNSFLPFLSSDDSMQTSSFSPDSSSALTGTSTPSAVTLTVEMAHLLHAYQNKSGVARWMDLFDHGATYQRAVARRVLRSELLLRCVCAFTAQHLSLLKSGEIWQRAAARYYGESLRMLIGLLGSPMPQNDALTATMLLCSFEMIAAQGSEHRRHFFGAMLLITTHGISARSIGIDRANFWIYVRHEIVVALVNESSLLLNPDTWDVSWREDETEEDALGNQVLWLLGRAVNFTYAKDPWTGEPMGTVTERRDLTRDTDLWFDKLPVAFQGFKYGNETDDGLSHLHFAVPAAAAAMMQYHLIYILLHAESHLRDPSQSPQVQLHATQIVRIAISDIPDAVRVFSPQALFYAAKHIHGLAKKARLWILLGEVEERLGFHTSSRVKRLQQLVEGSY